MWPLFVQCKYCFHYAAVTSIHNIQQLMVYISDKSNWLTINTLNSYEMLDESKLSELTSKSMKLALSASCHGAKLIAK